MGGPDRHASSSLERAAARPKALLLVLLASCGGGGAALGRRSGPEPARSTLPLAARSSSTAHERPELTPLERPTSAARRISEPVTSPPIALPRPSEHGASSPPLPSRERWVPGRDGPPSALSGEDIRNVVAASLPALLACEEHGRPPRLGRIFIVVGPSGAVLRAEIEDQSPFSACVLEVLSALEFPPPRGGGIVIITYPNIGTSS